MKFRNAKFVIPENVLAREVEGELVVLNLETDQYYGLDETGTVMWTLLTSHSSIDEVFEKLVSKYDASAEVIGKDLESLIDGLLKEGLLEIKSG